MSNWFDDDVFETMSEKNRKKLEPYKEVVKYITEQGYRVMSFGPGIQFSKPETPDLRLNLGPAEVALFRDLLEKKAPVIFLQEDSPAS